jgi:NADH:ubiquinone oxidoreductase subunit 6 (subunit J)
MSEESKGHGSTVFALFGLAILIAIVISLANSVESEAENATEGGALAYLPDSIKPYVQVVFMFASILLVIAFLGNIGWIRPIIKPKQRQDPFADPDEDE